MRKNSYRIEKEILNAEKEIQNFKKNSLSKINLISEDVVSNLIKDIFGEEINSSSIKASVAKLDAAVAFKAFGDIPENTNFGIKSSVVKNLLDSNDVKPLSANQSEMTKTKLGKMISEGTFYVSCHMTLAQIEQMRSKKVLFPDLN